MKATTQTAHHGLQSVIKQISAAKILFIPNHQWLTTRFLLVFLFASLQPFSVYSSERYVGDWFETEIILFSQLDNKVKLKEVFNTSVPKPQPMQYLDLLSTYINPDIASLKTLLPSCNKMKGFPTEVAFTGNSFHDLKQLNDITYQLKTSHSMLFNNASSAWSNPFIGTEISLLSQQNKVLTEKSKVKHYPSKTVFSPTLCTISEREFQSLAINHKRYSYTGFPINTIPVAINAIENIESATAYLLSEKSLQLAEITDQLKRSKNFKPLLHMAWRQQVFNLKRAIPLKVFAGDTLKKTYFDALDYYQQQWQQKIDSPSLQNQLITSNTTDIDKNHLLQQKEKQQQVIVKNRHVQNIAKQIDGITTIEQAMTELALNDTITLGNKPVAEFSPPTMLQPWTIDGFIKLHILDNYLNITSDFNIVPVDLNSQSVDSIYKASKEHENTNTISMRQHRRVISSEIHYFDHPYMGMVIQIRKYQPQSPIMDADMTLNN